LHHIVQILGTGAEIRVHIQQTLFRIVSYADQQGVLLQIGIDVHELVALAMQFTSFVGQHFLGIAIH